MCPYICRISSGIATIFHFHDGEERVDGATTLILGGITDINPETRRIFLDHFQVPWCNPFVQLWGCKCLMIDTGKFAPEFRCPLGRSRCLKRKKVTNIYIISWLTLICLQCMASLGILSVPQLPPPLEHPPLRTLQFLTFLWPARLEPWKKTLVTFHSTKVAWVLPIIPWVIPRHCNSG